MRKKKPEIKTHAFASPQACRLANLDHSVVERIARRIDRALQELRALDRTAEVFGWSGSGVIIVSTPEHRSYVLAELGQGYDGGDPNVDHNLSTPGVTWLAEHR